MITFIRLICLQLAFICTYSYAYAAENPIIIDDILVTEEICELKNGSLTIIITGTYTDLIYSIDNGATFQTSNYFGNLGSGDYIAIVADASSCSEAFSIQIVDAPLPKVTIDFECEPEQNKVNVDLTPFSDGIQPFTYNWAGPNGESFDTPGLNQVDPGTYFVTVTDRLGCSIDTTLNFPICCELIVECNDSDTTYLNCISEVLDINALFLDNNTANDLSELSRTGINILERCSDIAVEVIDEYNANQECGSGPLVYKRIYRIDDGSNLSACENIIIIDNYGDITLENNPRELVISCNENIDDLINNWVDDIAGATVKACSGTYDVVTVPDIYTIAYSCIGTGSLDVEFLITDECNNELSFTSKISVIDITPPDIVCPDNIQISVAEPDFQQQIDSWLVDYISSDACSSADVIDDYSFDNLSFDCVEEMLTVRFVATDDCGNSSECISGITLTEIFVPQIICPEVLTIQCGGANNDFLVTEWLGMGLALGYDSNPIALDNDLDPSLLASLTCNMPLDVRFFALESCLQGVECETSVQIVDVIAPEIICPPSLTLINGDNNYENTIEDWLAVGSATDNCGDANLRNNFNIDELDFCNNDGDILVEYVAVDECDNESTCQSTILLSPYNLRIECPSDIIIDCGAPVELEVENWINSASAVENGIDIVSVSHDFDLANLNRTCDGITVVNFNASGTCAGSDESCSSTIKIIDTTAPNIICPQNVTLELSSEQLSNSISDFLESISSTDDCNKVSYDNNWNASLIDVVCSEDIEVLFVATDECDNASECTSMISLINNITPEILCPEEFSIYCNDPLLDDRILGHINRVEIQSSVDYDLSNDLNLELIDDDCEQDYFVDVDINVVDECGNTDMCTASLHIYPPPIVYIPNVFNPRSSDVNRTFTVFSNSSVVEVVSMVIYDRWGSPVFEEENFPPNDPEYGWDGFNGGSVEPSNVMSYFIKVTGILGDELEFTGTVQVMK
jgi:hypothetical protein